ncbi:protein FAM161B isoform X2 [Leucoraja erinacea]|uniref:protein FAM161B isoform X2 n=1 Tax=Leucoraja erinaceus TaxID=7782 RepID=UPI00245476CC|nr:protein FAM161B isoform X2 [Leucoraja erinacea]
MPGSLGLGFTGDPGLSNRSQCLARPLDWGQAEGETAGGRGRPQIMPENDTNSSNESPNVGFNKSNKGELMDFLSQDQGDSKKQYYEGLIALQDSCRQRLLALDVQYEQLTNKHKLEHTEINKNMGLTEEVVKFFAMNEGRISLNNRSPKPNPSGDIMKRNSYSGNEFCSLTASEGSVEKDYLQPKKSSRPKNATSAWISQITVPQPFNMTMRESQKKTEVLRSRVTLEMEKQLVEKWQKEEAECQKKFRALPAPGHVYLQLYDEINEQNDEKRRKEMEKRQEYLLSTQKPFSFTKKEEGRKEKLKEQLHTLVPEAENTTKQIKKIPRSVKDASMSEKLKENELYRKIRIQMRAEDLLKKAAAPVDQRPSKKTVTTSSMRTRQEKLAFLEEKPKFKPRINPEIPDYTKLYNAFQREARKETKETTKCVPFELQTSKLPPRHSKDKSKIGSKDSHKNTQNHLKKSNSFSDIRSLFSHTLPISTTNAARKRQSAVRKSLEERDKHDVEKAEWMERYKMNVHDMRKTLPIRAKAMDPHQSLAETFKGILKKHRQTDLKRKNEYKKELEAMKRRVCGRPYLFEQVSQKNATFEAEKRYRETLRQAGVDEEFVRDKGGNAEDIPLTLSDLEDSIHESECRSLYEGKNRDEEQDEDGENGEQDEDGEQYEDEEQSHDEEHDEDGESGEQDEDGENEEQEENGEQDDERETVSDTDQEHHFDSHVRENSTCELD